MTGQPHDSVFKYAFSAPERAAEELRAVLPPEIIARIDWSTLKLEPGEFIDEELRKESTDLLFSARVAGRPTLAMRVPPIVPVVLHHGANGWTGAARSQRVPRPRVGSATRRRTRTSMALALGRRG